MLYVFKLCSFYTFLVQVLSYNKKEEYNSQVAVAILWYRTAIGIFLKTDFSY